MQLTSFLQSHKPTLLRVIFSVVAALSISGAHYIGFLGEVPLQILSVAGPELAPSFIGTFAFYAVISLAAARVLTHLFGAFILLIAALAVRITEHKRLRFAKFFLRVFRHEGPLVLSLQILFFTLFFAQIYLDFSLKQLSAAVGATTALLLVAAFLRTDALALSPKIFLRRIRSPRRKVFRVRLAVSILSSAIGAALFVAAYTGAKRAEYLVRSDPVAYSDQYFTGNIHVLLSSAHATLAIEFSGKHRRFLYFSERFVLCQEPTGIAAGTFVPVRKRGG